MVMETVLRNQGEQNTQTKDNINDEPSQHMKPNRQPAKAVPR